MNRPLGRPRNGWENNIRIDLRDTAWKVVNWMHLAEDRNQWRDVVNMVMNLRGPKKAGNFLIS
jgi:hypothetical protein